MASATAASDPPAGTFVLQDNANFFLSVDANGVVGTSDQAFNWNVSPGKTEGSVYLQDASGLNWLFDSGTAYTLVVKGDRDRNAEWTGFSTTELSQVLNVATKRALGIPYNTGNATWIFQSADQK
ncbi:hypothetical protein QBC46DRAFT_426428 [Diplogelasinospora grovesii]|uniref:Uncharacterized protein n=1 Tax=Diplogelasinospora grovesii TaxID=303347 RepID=A0AAN6S653_9PEZI|nr:hypothetical protein QBC46DRAFT_426428 [Diplogelasinospora grovesii]